MITYLIYKYTYIYLETILETYPDFNVENNIKIVLKTTLRKLHMDFN